MKIQRSIAQSISPGATWEERWSGADEGLIAAWEAGRQLGLDQPELASRARDGELLPLPWKGGWRKKPEPDAKSTKHGPYLYLAMWQGLRGQDLLIETHGETDITCSSTKATTIKVPFNVRAKPGLD